MHELTGFQRDILYVIAGHGKPHGIAVQEGLEDYYDTEVHHGRLYPNLDSLVDDGLVEKGKRNKRTNYYVLTEQGQSLLEHRRSWEQQFLD